MLVWVTGTVLGVTVTSGGSNTYSPWLMDPLELMAPESVPCRNRLKPLEGMVSTSVGAASYSQHNACHPY